MIDVTLGIGHCKRDHAGNSRLLNTPEIKLRIVKDRQDLN